VVALGREGWERGSARRGGVARIGEFRGVRVRKKAVRVGTGREKFSGPKTRVLSETVLWNLMILLNIKSDSKRKI
jgi:hypothetical protein